MFVFTSIFTVVSVPIWLLVAVALAGELMGVLSVILASWILGNTSRTRDQDRENAELSGYIARVTADDAFISNENDGGESTAVLTRRLPPSPLAARPVLEYQYFVTGNVQPFSTLAEALVQFPLLKNKSAAWEELPKYVRSNIRREVANKIVPP